MKVTLNLSTVSGSRERYALAWAVPVLIVGVAGLVFLSVSIMREYRQYRAVRRSVTEYEARANSLRQREAALRKELEKPELRDLYRQVQYLNALIEQKQVSLTGVTETVTKLLPGDVHLTGLALVSQADGFVVRFGLTGRSEEAVETFLANLEDSPNFKDVTITNEGFQEQGGVTGPVVISCSARYLVGVP